MRSRQVTHWHCDFCKKVTHTRHSIMRHEASCTANPNRVCKMCAMAGLEQKPIAGLHAIIAGSTWEDTKEKEAREYVSGCPACLLAALRQWDWKPDEIGFAPYPGFSVNWKEESKAWLEKYGRTYAEDYR